MQMSLITCVNVKLRQEMKISGGITRTVFPMSENWLNEDSDHQNAVREVGAMSKAESFKSLMDYLFANVFPGTYWMVMDFYADEGPPLREVLTRQQCYMIDCRLVEALKLAYSDFCEGRQRSWSRIRRTSDRRYLRMVG